MPKVYQMTVRLPLPEDQWEAIAEIGRFEDIFANLKEQAQNEGGTAEHDIVTKKPRKTKPDIVPPPAEESCAVEDSTEAAPVGRGGQEEAA